MIAKSFIAFSLAVALATDNGSNESRARESASIVRTYDLGAIQTLGSVEGRLGLLPYLQPGLGDEGSERYTHLSPEFVVGMLSTAFPEQFEYADREMWLGDRGLLHARAPEALHEQLARFLADLERAAAAHVVLRVDILTLPSARIGDAGSKSIVSAAEAAELRALAAASRRTHRVAAYPGRLAEIVARRQHELLLDYDLEVAQGAFVHDPIVRTVSVGTRAMLRAAPARGGLEIALVLQRAEPRGEPRTIQARSRGFVSGESFQEFASTAESRQTIEVLDRSLAVNAFLADGRALVYRSDLALGTGAEDPALTELVIVERESGELPPVITVGQDGGRVVRFVNTEQIEPPYCTADESFLEYNLQGISLDRLECIDPELVLGAEMRSGDANRVLEMLSGSSTGMWYESDGPWILATEDADSAAEIRESGGTVATLQAALDAYRGEPEMIELTLVARRGSGEGGRPVRCVLPLRVGRDCIAVLGRETFVVTDADVEIAQNAGALDIQTRVQFDGLFLFARPHRGAGGSLVVELRGQVHLARQGGRLELESPMLDAFDLASFDQLGFDERLVVTSSEPQTLVRSEFAGGGEDSALALEFGVRALPR